MTTHMIDTAEGSFTEELVIQAGLRSIVHTLLPHMPQSVLDAMARDCADDPDLSALLADPGRMATLSLPNVNALHTHGRRMMQRRLLTTLTPETLEMAYATIQHNREVWLDGWKTQMYLALHPTSSSARMYGLAQSKAATSAATMTTAIHADTPTG